MRGWGELGGARLCVNNDIERGGHSKERGEGNLYAVVRNVEIKGGGGARV
jgi:hypothetical protein